MSFSSLCPRCGDPGSLDCPDPCCPIVEAAIERAHGESVSSRRKEGGHNARQHSDLELFAKDDPTIGQRPRGHKGAEYRLQARIACWLWEALPPGCGTFWSSLENNFAVKSKTAFFRRLRGIKAGVPDLLFIRNGWPRFVELKASRKTRPSPKQKAVGRELEAVGAKWAVCRSGEEVERQLRRWRIPLACPYRDDLPIPDHVKSHHKSELVRPLTYRERGRLNAARRTHPAPGLEYFRNKDGGEAA